MLSLETAKNVVTYYVSELSHSQVISSMVGVFLILYASLAAPKLPLSVVKWFDNTWFKLFIMFLIAYMATRNASVAIIAAVALLVTLQSLSIHRTTSNVINAVHNARANESFDELQPDSMTKLSDITDMLPGLNNNENNNYAEAMSQLTNVPEHPGVMEASKCGNEESMVGYDGTELSPL